MGVYNHSGSGQIKVIVRASFLVQMYFTSTMTLTQFKHAYLELQVVELVVG